MPTAAEILSEVERLRDFFEQRWNLPWYADKASAPIWRHRLVHLLAQLPDELFDECMALMLQNTSFAVKGIALHLLRMRDRTSFAPLVRELLDHKSIHVRALAAAALGQFGDADDLEALLESKDSEHAEVKKAVVDALRRIRDTRAIPLIARWVGRVGEDDELRRKACEALGAIGDDAAMPVLARVLEDDTVVDAVRGDAALAIGQIGGREARALLLRCLRSDRPWIRARSAQGLSLLGDASLLRKILPLLGTSEPWMVRTCAIEAVGRLGGRDALPHLLPLVTDGEARIRGEVCVALGSIAGPEATQALRDLLGDPELPVRIQALGAFSKLTEQDFGFRVEDHQGSLDIEALDRAIARARTFHA